MTHCVTESLSTVYLFTCITAVVNYEMCRVEGTDTHSRVANSLGKHTIRPADPKFFNMATESINICWTDLLRTSYDCVMKRKKKNSAEVVEKSKFSAITPVNPSEYFLLSFVYRIFSSCIGQCVWQRSVSGDGVFLSPLSFHCIPWTHPSSYNQSNPQAVPNCVCI